RDWSSDVCSSDLHRQPPVPSNHPVSCFGALDSAGGATLSTTTLPGLLSTRPFLCDPCRSRHRGFCRTVVRDKLVDPRQTARQSRSLWHGSWFSSSRGGVLSVAVRQRRDQRHDPEQLLVASDTTIPGVDRLRYNQQQHL